MGVGVGDYVVLGIDVVWIEFVGVEWFLFEWCYVGVGIGDCGVVEIVIVGVFFVVEIGIFVVLC